MNEDRQELLFDLLAKKAIYGLDDTEQRQLDELDTATSENEFRSLEITATAIGLIGVEQDEPLPAHLRSSILASADAYFTAGETVPEDPWSHVKARQADIGSEQAVKSRSSIFGWLGWAVAAAACIALALNLWFTRTQQPPDIVKVQPPDIPQMKTPAQMRAEFMASTPNMTKASWAPGNVKEIKAVGDIVWSDDKQAGYMLLRGLPVNDTGTTTYQLWIYDKTRDKNPIDGGTFDVSADGEAVIAINAKLKAQRPEMFAITMEKPGGVVVSEGKKIAALAKVDGQAS